MTDKTHMRVLLPFDNLDKELQRLEQFLEWADQAHREIGTMNLLVQRNVPVTFAANAADVIVRVRGVSDQGKFHVGDHRLKCLANFERVIFGLEASDVEEVAAWFKTEPAHSFSALGFPCFGAIGNHRRLLAVPFAIVALNLDGVRHHCVWEDVCHSF